jgi:hypothetical protein
MLLQWFTMEKLSQVVDLNWQQFKCHVFVFEGYRRHH